MTSISGTCSEHHSFHKPNAFIKDPLWRLSLWMAFVRIQIWRVNESLMIPPALSTALSTLDHKSFMGAAWFNWVVGFCITVFTLQRVRQLPCSVAMGIVFLSVANFHTVSYVSAWSDRKRSCSHMEDRIITMLIWYNSPWCPLKQSSPRPYVYCPQWIGSFQINELKLSLKLIVRGSLVQGAGRWTIKHRPSSANGKSFNSSCDLAEQLKEMQAKN